MITVNQIFVFMNLAMMMITDRYNLCDIHDCYDDANNEDYDADTSAVADDDDNRCDFSDEDYTVCDDRD